MIDIKGLRDKVDADLAYYHDLNERCENNMRVTRKPGTITPSRKIWSRSFYIHRYLTWLSRTLEPIEEKGRPL